MSWIQTLDGQAFDLLAPDYRKIDPNTLAVCLARTCRFKGHCREFYSVAQHSLLVESFVAGGGKFKLAALLHDAHECYDGFGDVARPAKYLDADVRRFLKDLQQRHNAQIARRFGFDPVIFESGIIADADALALSTERRDNMAPCDREWEELPQPSPFVIVEPWGIDESYRRFTARLYELWSD